MFYSRLYVNTLLLMLTHSNLTLCYIYISCLPSFHHRAITPGGCAKPPAGSWWRCKPASQSSQCISRLPAPVPRFHSNIRYYANLILTVSFHFSVFFCKRSHHRQNVPGLTQGRGCEAAHQATDERLHGVGQGGETEDPGETSRHAQLQHQQDIG